MPKTYQYSISEGVLLRSPEGEFLPEAWGDGRWFFYADICEDIWESSLVDDADVPPEAAAAPSYWDKRA